jgi:tRNA threonylcarbamoyladenosine biosynthesis protein TsaE
MVANISHKPADTEALGESWGRAARRGLVIGLSGDLGAGKTQLVKGLARGLGFPGRVHSPTFTLVNVYSGGRLTLFHLDLYRLETRGQIVEAGLEEYLDPAGVAVVEWAERWFEEVPGARGQVSGGRCQVSGVRCQVSGGLRLVKIETLSETERRITYEDFGG